MTILSNNQNDNLTSRFMVYASVALLLVLGALSYLLYEHNKKQLLDSMNQRVEAKITSLATLSAHYISNFELELLQELQKSVETESNVNFVSIKNELAGTQYGVSKKKKGIDTKLFSKNIVANNKLIGSIHIGWDTTYLHGPLNKSLAYAIVSMFMATILLGSLLALFFKHQVNPELARFRMALDSTGDAIYLLDKTTLKILDANQSAWGLLGYSREDLLKKELLEIFPGSAVKTLHELLENSDNSNNNRIKSVVIEQVCQRSDGSQFPAEIDLETFRGTDAELVVAVARDITERKRVEEALISAKIVAETANNAKSELLARMSHELRTPMNSVLGFADLLKLDEALNTEQKQYVQYILDSGRHLLELINEVLDLSKFELGMDELSTEPITLSPLIHECFDLMKPLADKQGIVMRYEDKPSDPVIVQADRLSLKQVLLNLLSNAVKYSGAEREIAVSLTSDSAGFVRVNVSDTGDGIDPERIGELFQPLNRLGAEYTDIEGHGVGLAISKRLVELMDGTIGVESERGKGSVFWFELPASIEPAAKTGL